MARRDQERLERQRGTSQPSGKRELIVSKTWLQVAALVVVVGFFVLGLLAYRTYQSDPPIPARAVDPSGATVYTQDDVSEGQQVFLRHGLMEYGSIFGHGAYLGPDFTADYLRRSSVSVRDQLGGDESDSARQETIDQFQVQPLLLGHRNARAVGRAGGRVRAAQPALRALLPRADHPLRSASRADRQLRADHAADLLLRLVELGRLGPPARP
jgi:hypothetical protein